MIGFPDRRRIGLVNTLTNRVKEKTTNQKLDRMKRLISLCFNSMNRKTQFIAGFVIMLMPPDAWSQTTPASFMAVPGDGRATLRWDSVPNATGYNVKQGAGALTVIATNVAESSFVITNLGNGSTYFFAVSAVADVFQSADTPRLRIVPSGPVLDLLPAGAKLERLVTGLQFPEGPVWIPEKEGYLIFSDVDGNAMYRWSPTAGKTVFRKPSNSANGNGTVRIWRAPLLEEIAAAEKSKK
jgi:hypothetical protein